MLSTTHFCNLFSILLAEDRNHVGLVHGGNTKKLIAGVDIRLLGKGDTGIGLRRIPLTVVGYIILWHRCATEFRLVVPLTIRNVLIKGLWRGAAALVELAVLTPVKVVLMVLRGTGLGLSYTRIGGGVSMTEKMHCHSNLHKDTMVEGGPLREFTEPKLNPIYERPFVPFTIV